MFANGERSAETTAAYKGEASRLVTQFLSEPLRDEAPILYESPLLGTARWFLDTHERWSGSTIRLFAAALHQEVAELVLAGEFVDHPGEQSLLWRLKRKRPRPALTVRKSKKGKQVAHQTKTAAKNKRRKRRKSIDLIELRTLIEFFRLKADSFALWIVGYILVASRLGWRPGEIVSLTREVTVLRAKAEKRSNGRGLSDTCEIDISAYVERGRLFKNQNLLSQLDKWIADGRKWAAYYGGHAELQDNINSRLATACKKIGIERVCTYTFRHFAISCMKASGFSRAEIAVIVNHATDRTAGEYYGKRRFGRKRTKKTLGLDPPRLLLVRNQARIFKSNPEKKKRDAEKKSAEVPTSNTSEGPDTGASPGMGA